MLCALCNQLAHVISSGHHFRLVQYGSKTVSWSLELRGARADLVERIKALEASISTARKRKFPRETRSLPQLHLSPSPTVFRLGMSIDSLRSALQTLHLASPVLRVLLTLARVCRGLYLLLDHLLWASRMRLITIDDRYWGRLSNRFWLAAIFLSLMRDLYEILVALRLQKNRLNQYGSASTPASTQAVVGGVIRTSPALVVDVVKNLTDVWIPASRLDLLYLPSGVVGLAGVISSLAGLLGSHDQKWRLKFS